LLRRVADFRLNRMMSAPCGAFLRGFFDLLQPQWITMFNESELQMLISGGGGGGGGAGGKQGQGHVLL
jgi:ubiquitin-protein ligase E3 C